jgi:hypothetical protein
MRGNAIIIAGVALVLAIVAAVALWPDPERGEHGFDAAVAAPAYVERGPLVLFDEAHGNAGVSTGALRSFARLLRSDGYDLRVNDGPLNAAALTPAAVLIVAAARGDNEAGDVDAFTGPEASVISEWVLRGGALLLVTDSGAYGAAASGLADRFGVDMNGGVTSDAANSGARADQLIFSRQNGLLLAHPTTEGRGPAERVDCVATFAGQSVHGPADARPLLRLAATAQDRLRDGRTASAVHRVQGVALRFGRGRVVVLGDLDMLRAGRGEDGAPVGLSHPGCGNRQFALNIMHWLTRLI